MTNHPHLEELRARHRKLDERIASNEKHHPSIDVENKTLKREKFRLKQQITNFESASA